jgi:hypothetical protein
MALIKRPASQADKPFLLRMMIYGDGSVGKTTNLASFLKNPNIKQVIWIAVDATTLGSLNFVDDVWGVQLSKGQLFIAEVPKVSTSSLDAAIDNASAAYLAVHKPLLGGYPAYDAFDGSPIKLKKPSDYGEDTLIIVDGLSSYNDKILFKGNANYALRTAGKGVKQYDGVYNDHKELLHKLSFLIQSANCHVAVTAHNFSANSADAVLTPYGLNKNFPNILVKSMLAEFTKDFNWILVARKTLSGTGKPERFLVGFDPDWFTKTSFNEVTFEKECEAANLDRNTMKPKKNLLEHVSLKRLPCDLTHPIYPFLKGETT